MFMDDRPVIGQLEATWDSIAGLGHDLSADLPGLWRIIEPQIAAFLPQAPRPTP